MGLFYTCMLSVDGVQWVWFNSVVHVALVKRLSLCVYVTRSCTQVCVSWHLSLTPSFLLYCTVQPVKLVSMRLAVACPAQITVTVRQRLQYVPVMRDTTGVELKAQRLDVHVSSLVQTQM